MQPRSLRATVWNWPHLVLLGLMPLWWWWTVSIAHATQMLLPAWVLVNFVVFGVAERLAPRRDDWRPNAAHLRRDGAVLSVNAVVDALLSVGLGAWAATWTAGDNPLPLAVQATVGIVVSEAGSYAIHRASHAGGWLWRVHLLHHRPERMNVANALTAHPFNACYDRVLRLLPLLAMELDAEAIVLITLFGATQSLATHANVAGTIGPLRYLIGSAELHRLHHSTDPAQAAGNFGTTTPLWDQLFGTFRLGEPPRAVGVYEPARYPDELALFALLRWPFVPAPRRERPAVETRDAGHEPRTGL